MSTSARTIPKAGAIASLIILAGAALGMGVIIKLGRITTRTEAIYPKDDRQVSKVLPESPSWVRIGADQTMSKEIEEELGTQNHLSRTYYYKNSPDKNNPVILELHLAYYTGMIDTVPHVPDRCFVGGGMSIEADIGEVPIPLNMEGLTLVTEGISEADRGRIFETRIVSTLTTKEAIQIDGQHVKLPRDPDKLAMKITKFSGPKVPSVFSGYFFVANGGTVASGDGVRFLAFDLKSKYAYYMKVQFTSATVKSAEELAKYAGLFLDENFGDIMLCVPDWVDVMAGRYPPKDENGGSGAGGVDNAR